MWSISTSMWALNQNPRSLVLNTWPGLLIHTIGWGVWKCFLASRILEDRITILHPTYTRYIPASEISWEILKSWKWNCLNNQSGWTTLERTAVGNSLLCEVGGPPEKRALLPLLEPHSHCSFPGIKQYIFRDAHCAQVKTLEAIYLFFLNYKLIATFFSLNFF